MPRNLKAEGHNFWATTMGWAERHSLREPAVLQVDIVAKIHNETLYRTSNGKKILRQGQCGATCHGGF